MGTQVTPPESRAGLYIPFGVWQFLSLLLSPLALMLLVTTIRRLPVVYSFVVKFLIPPPQWTYTQQENGKSSVCLFEKRMR